MALIHRALGEESLEAYSEPCKTSKMNRFAKIVNG